MKNSIYYQQAELLLRVLPAVAIEPCFALKGGTAINFFIRDLPRLSIDIDLTYLPIESRDQTLLHISEGLQRISQKIERILPDAKVQHGSALGSKHTRKLMVKRQNVQIIIEPNEIIRGAVFPPIQSNLSSNAEELFGMSVEINTLSFADLYGGKICAALDRQHPRDLFDIKLLFDNEGITDDVRKSFVVYLASHNRPISELLDPPRLEIYSAYQNEFVGMAVIPMEYEFLLAIREKLILTLRNNLTDAEKHFLISIKEGEPKWELLNIAGIDLLPAIQWKLKNIKQMNKSKHQSALDELKRKLRF